MFIESASFPGVTFVKRGPPQSTGREPGGCGGAGPLVSAVLDGDDEPFAECIGQASEG
jgi:hypothetical protein